MPNSPEPKTERLSAAKKLKRAARVVWDAPPVLWTRGMLFNSFEYLTGYWLERRKFKKKHGYELRLDNPRSFSQKLVWKKLHDRNPLLRPTSDKYLVREYVRSALGKEAEDVLIPLLAVAADPEAIPFDSLSGDYIIKTNHDSGGNIIVRGNETPDHHRIKRQLKAWMGRPYGLFKHEWGYGSIRRKLIVEQLLRGDDDDLAQDYKFHVFHGKVRFIHTTPKVNGIRTGKRSLFTPDWKLLPVGWKHPAGPYVPPPPRLTDMLRIAETLALPFDYVRVDLYSARNRVYFGELTHYHGGGMEKFDPQSFDFEAGEWWSLTPRYWNSKAHEA